MSYLAQVSACAAYRIYYSAAGLPLYACFIGYYSANGLNIHSRVDAVTAVSCVCTNLLHYQTAQQMLSSQLDRCELTSSGQQTERPKRCKVVLKQVSFDRGVYEQLRSDTPLTASSTDDYWQQEQQQLQQLQQYQQSSAAAPVQLRVAVAAPPAALRSDRNDRFQPTATATTSATANAVRHAT
eukprot:3805-Heterococcus_DN1.PRE.3